MAGVNKVILIGNLGRDPEVRTTASGTSVCNFSIATSEKYTDKNGGKQETTEWHNVLMWGKLADIAGQYLKKGKTVYIEGKLQTSSWEDKNGGGKRYKTEIVASSMQMLSGNNSQSQNTAQNDNNNFPTDPQDGFPMPGGVDDDLPF